MNPKTGQQTKADLDTLIHDRLWVTRGEVESPPLVALRKELAQQEADFRKREAFLTETQKRLSDQFSDREKDLAKREAWVSALTVRFSWRRL